MALYRRRRGDGPQQHAAFIAERREWLAESDNGECAGFIAVQVQGAIGTSPNCRSPARQRQGVGRRLIGAVAEEAKRQGAGRLTLTTFIEVPWNAPTTGGGISAARGRVAHGRPAAAPDEDLAHGFAAGSRCAMEFTLS
ncbi:GNAT family N-acetyltransferase [Serratia marcescens]|uniref:GNAT family N-acetyltransferase n=1 Tax=Serratia marcescens TaxID=615 RepID=A0A939NT04_SERMA|nr:GNAT family N-acetyltransferase [Serratia marcescens]